MKPLLMLSCAGLLLLCGLLLNAASLQANGPPSQDPKSKTSSESQIDNPPVPQPANPTKKAARDQRGTEKQPIFIKLVNPSKGENDTAQEQKQRDEKLSLDRETVALNRQTVAVNQQMVRFTGVLALIAALQALVLIAQAFFNRAVVVNQRIIERAYVKLSHKPPGLNFHEVHTVHWWVPLQVGNFGRTPARITHVIICRRYFPVNEHPPVTPDYSHEPQERLEGAFLLPDDKLFFTFQGRFQSIGEESLIREGQGRFVLYGYVDYIDQFGQRHRAGYGREYSAELDDRETYATDANFMGRSNLPFVPEPGYNYDRKRQKGEGRDWPA